MKVQSFSALRRAALCFGCMALTAGAAGDRPGAPFPATKPATGDMSATIKKSAGRPVASLAERLKSASDATSRRNIYAELRDHRFDRAEAIKLLTSGLTDGDLGVRVSCAQLLYQLGSAAGKEVLLSALKDAANTPAESLPEVLTAAQVLSRNKEDIPAPLLVSLLKELGRPEVLEIMAVQGDKEFALSIQDAVKKEKLAGSLHLLGLLGDPSGYAPAEEIFKTTRNPATKVAAAWAMYRSSNDPLALQYVQGVAERFISGAKMAEDGSDADTRHYALQELYLTPEPVVRDLLRKMLTEPAVNDTNGALASLFLVQQDYAFIDDFLRQYLAHPQDFPRIDPGLAGRIASARNSPELLAIAENGNSEFYHVHVEPMLGLPPQSWGWLYLHALPRH